MIPIDVDNPSISSLIGNQDITKCKDFLGKVIRAHPHFGYYFDALEVASSGRLRFRLSPHSQLRYPDDEAAGLKYMAGEGKWACN